MISIDGLTKAQMKLLDIMWNMDTMEDIERFINTFGPKRQKECRLLIELAKLAAIDEIEKIDQDTIELINNIKNFN